MTLIASSLRRAIGVRITAGRYSSGVMLQRRRQISNRRESQARDRRILGFIRDLIRHPRFEPALEQDPVRIVDYLPLLGAPKLPVFARDQPWRCHPTLALREPVGGILRFNRRISR